MITTEDIEEGLARGHFCLHYQPKLSLVTGKVAGSEALLRWNRPDGTVLGPAAFLGLAERSGLVKRIGAYIVPLLFSDLPALQSLHFTPVSFNLTAGDFEDALLTQQIIRGIADARIPPEDLEVEITETVALASDETVADNIRRLRSAGVGLAMDDYGIGYSSVDSLSQWPFSTIKIDQGLISRMLHFEKSARIVRSAIRMAHELDLDVVAEGVETEAQYRFLLEAGCKKIQGYLIGRPTALGEAVDLTPGERPRLPVGMLHMIKMDILQWRKQLLAYALAMSALPPDAPERQSRDHPVLLRQDCVFAKRWLFGEGQVFSHLDAFGQLSAALYQASGLGKAVVKQVQAGAARPDIAGQLKELEQVANAALEALAALEVYCLSMAYPDTLH